MSHEHLPPAPEPNPHEAAFKATTFRILGAAALGTAAVLVSAEFGRVGVDPNLVTVFGDGVLVAIGTYSLSLAAKYDRQADS